MGATAAVASAVFAGFSLIEGKEQARKAERRQKKATKEANAQFAKQQSDLKDEQRRTKRKKVQEAVASRRKSSAKRKLKGGTIVTGPQGASVVTGGAKSLLGA